MHLPEASQLLLYLGQTFAQRRLRIRCSKCGVRLSLLPPGILPRLAFCRALVIGNGAADDLLQGILKWIAFANHIS